MKKFVELIKRVHQERFPVVMNRIVAEKIPVAFLSVAPIEQAIGIVKNIRAQNVNIDNLITTTLPQNVQTDFRITSLADADKIHPRPEYILVTNNIDARVSVKNLPDIPTLSIDRGNSIEDYEAFMNHLPELQEVYESLPDETSRRTFCGYWLSKISNKIGEIVYSKSAHYLVAGFIPEPGAIVIDGGVFDGGTAKVFTEMGYKVYGFEMNRENFNIAKKVAEESGFTVENFALGSYKHELRYDPGVSSGSRQNHEGAEVAAVTTLDAYVRENNIPRVDFIKLDVEGAELEILKGARTCIARWKPILAISAYHKLDDFWVLMNFIKSIRPDYEFALRQSAETAEEEPINVSRNFEDYMNFLGLEPELRYFWECVLFAR